MPGFATHYIFGKESIKKYKNNYVSKCIKENQSVFNIGLQGPDIFFYYVFSPMIYDRNIGSIMHTTDIGKFKKNFLRIIKQVKDEKDKKILVAYFAGFVGHCTLDMICHPYIYAATDYVNKKKDYFSKHVDFETNIDYLYVKRYLNMELYDFNKKQTIRISKRELELIADVFVKAFRKTYANVKLSQERMRRILYIFLLGSSVFYDRTGLKRKVAGGIENAVFGRKVVSPMFVEKKEYSDKKDILNKSRKCWKNPWEMSVCRYDDFDGLFGNAMDILRDSLDELDRCLMQNHNERGYLLNNLSLHSGLDCSIPS